VHNVFIRLSQAIWQTDNVHNSLTEHVQCNRNLSNLKQRNPRTFQDADIKFPQPTLIFWELSRPLKRRGNSRAFKNFPGCMEPCLKIPGSASGSESQPKCNGFSVVTISHLSLKQEAQLMLTNLHDTFRGQSRSPNIVPFHVRHSFLLVWNSNFVFKARHFSDIWLQKCCDLEIQVRGHSRCYHSIDWVWFPISVLYKLCP